MNDLLSMMQDASKNKKKKFPESRKYSIETIEKVHSLYHDGFKAREISNNLGIPYGTVYGWIRTLKNK